MNKEQCIIGTKVIYWSIIKEGGLKLDPFHTEITSEPWELAQGVWVCKVSGRSGDISIDHLEIEKNP